MILAIYSRSVYIPISGIVARCTGGILRGLVNTGGLRTRADSGSKILLVAEGDQRTFSSDILLAVQQRVSQMGRAPW